MAIISLTNKPTYKLYYICYIVRYKHTLTYPNKEMEFNTEFNKIGHHDNIDQVIDT